MCKIQIFWKPVLVRFEIIHIHYDAWLCDLGCSLMKMPMIIEKMQWGNCGSDWSKTLWPFTEESACSWYFELYIGPRCPLGNFFLGLDAFSGLARESLHRAFLHFPSAPSPLKLRVFTPSSSVFPSLTFFFFF